MNSIKTSSKRRLIVIAVTIVTVVGVVVVLAIAYKHAWQSANRSCGFGRLCNIQLALLNYEQQFGTLPPLCLRDKQGKPIHSWRALILLQLGTESFKQLDLSQPWNSDYNRKIIDGIPLREWNLLARDQDFKQFPVFTHILALHGANSIWDTTTGLPKGKTKDHPNAILLISIPQSHIEPLQPGDVTEDEVRKMVEDGQEVLFSETLGHWGVVTIEDDKLTFRTWKEERDRKGETP